MTGNSGGDMNIYYVDEQHASSTYPVGMHVRTRSYYSGQDVTVYAKPKIYRDENRYDWDLGNEVVIAYTKVKGYLPNIDDPYHSYTQYAYRIEFEDSSLFNTLQEYGDIHCCCEACRTGEALPLVTSASSGAAKSLIGGPCVWRGKENPWGNVGSLVCDMLFWSPERFVLDSYFLSDVKKYDGTINEHYRKSNMVAKYWKGYSYGINYSFDTEIPYLIVPASVQTSYAWKNSAARYYMSNESYDYVKHLRVGGDFRDSNATQHATYEVLEHQIYIDRFGGRLIVEERS
jgi:hypothetical protein